MNRTAFFLAFFVCAAQPLDAQQPIRVITGHSDVVVTLGFSPDGQVFASSANDGATKVFGVESGKELRAFKTGSEFGAPLAFSPDGKVLAIGGGEAASHGPGDTPTKPGVGHITLYEIPTGREMFKRRRVGDTTTALRFSKDGKVLIAAYADGAVEWQDAATGRILERIQRTMGQYSAPVNISPDGGAICWAGLGKLRILDRATKKEWTREHRAGVNHEYWLWREVMDLPALAFSPDGRLLASGTDYVKLWNVPTGKLEGSLPTVKPRVGGIAFSPDGKILATGGGTDSRSPIEFDENGEIVPRKDRRGAGEIRFWSVAEKNELRAVTSLKEAVSALAFSPDGRILASGCADGTIHLWRVPEPGKKK